MLSGAGCTINFEKCREMQTAFFIALTVVIMYLQSQRYGDCPKPSRYQRIKKYRLTGEVSEKNRARTEARTTGQKIPAYITRRNKEARK